ncbi:BofC C-terminal domain-containing protein [Alkalihalobacillus sp. 1P02AB]|uniref:BofC C-terminal domain-containing protein n=1 Tax=Alkalihalobacillus sp. 1P02AB TaxID=3132260 RepID=UPI0039A613B3
MKVMKYLTTKKEYPIILFLIVIMVSTIFYLQGEAEDPVKKLETENIGAFAPLTMNIKLERIYLDGGKSEETIEETIWSVEDFWAHYDEWELINQNQEQIIFRMEMDDISPIVKINGYFGLSENGFLQMFEGKPEEEQIIQSFFQIDTEKLETYQQHELKEGIRIENKEQYRQILDVFKNLEKADV